MQFYLLCFSRLLFNPLRLQVFIFFHAHELRSHSEREKFQLFILFNERFSYNNASLLLLLFIFKQFTSTLSLTITKSSIYYTPFTFFSLSFSSTLSFYFAIQMPQNFHQKIQFFALSQFFCI